MANNTAKHQDLAQALQRLSTRGETCLMNSVYSFELCQFLIDNGAQVNAQDNFGNTALHHAIKKGDLKIVQLLLDRGSDQNIQNKQGDDALQFASLHGQYRIVDDLVARKKPTEARWIESLQLLGCYFSLLEKADSVARAMVHWRKSVTFRGMNPRVEFRKLESMPDCVNVKAVNTVQELEELCQNQEMVHMYALESLLRILGPGHKKTTDGLIIVSQVFATKGEKRRSFDLLRYALQLLQERIPTWTKDYLLVLSMLHTACSDLFRETRHEIEFHDVFGILDMVTSKVQFVYTMKFHYISSTMQVILGFVRFGVDVDKSADQTDKFQQVVHRLVRSQIRDMFGWTFLHHAVDRCNIFPGVVEVLLECGADVNAVDSLHNTALHLCTLANNAHFAGYSFQIENWKLIKLLLQYSAHPDIVNASGEYAVTGLPLRMLDHVSLKCLATAVIRDHQIPYVGEIPETLESFVRMHGK